MSDNEVVKVRHQARGSQIGESSSMRTTLGECNKIVDVDICHPSSGRIDVYLAASSDIVYAALLFGWIQEYFQPNTTVWTSDLATN